MNLRGQREHQREIGFQRWSALRFGESPAGERLCAPAIRESHGVSLTFSCGAGVSLRQGARPSSARAGEAASPSLVRAPPARGNREPRFDAAAALSTPVSNYLAHRCCLPCAQRPQSLHVSNLGELLVASWLGCQRRLRCVNVAVSDADWRERVPLI